MENLIQERVQPMTGLSYAFASGKGIADSHGKTGDDYSTISWEQIKRLAENPQSVGKEKANWVMPSLYIGHDARVHEVQRERGAYGMLVMDIDEGNATLEEVDAAVTGIFGDAARIIYSTKSATEEAKKWRGMVLLNKPMTSEEYLEYHAAMRKRLAEFGVVCDASISRLGQVSFLPNRGKFYEQLLPKGDPADLSALQKTVEETRAELLEVEALNARFVAAEKTSRGGHLVKHKGQAASLPANSNAASASAIDWFNANNSVEALFSKYGYERRSGEIYISPQSKNKNGAVKLFDNGRWGSFSGSDAESGIGLVANDYCSGDAFDLLVHYEFGGDREAALSSVQKDKTNAEYFPAKEERDNGSCLAGIEAEQPNLILNERGRPYPNHQNFFEILSKGTDWLGVFAYDEFAMRQMLMRQISGQRGNPEKFTPRPLVDTDYIMALTWLNQNGFPTASKGTAQDAVDAVSRENIVSPVRHFLEDALA